MIERIDTTVSELQSLMDLQQLDATFWYYVSGRPSSKSRSLLIGCRGKVMSFWRDLASASTTAKPTNAIERTSDEPAESFLERILGEHKFWTLDSRHDGLRDGADGVFVFVSANRNHVVQLKKVGDCPELKQLTQYLESLMTAFN